MAKKSDLSIDQFLSNKEVLNCIQKLENKFGSGGRNMVVSDVIDTEGHQYVNLVQKGGGVLGVALVGYTYILEQMGIRFIRLAGTSAGAINTALMTVAGAEIVSTENGERPGVIGNKKIAKSTKILDIICKLNFFNLVDGHPAAKILIKKLISANGSDGIFNNRAKFILLLPAIMPLLALLCLGLQHQFAAVAYITLVLFIVSGFLIVLAIILARYVIYLLSRLKNSGFGINPGDYFYTWIKDRFEENHVNTVSDLLTVASTPVPDLSLRVENKEGLNDLQGDVTFITSELVTENKIEFPKMWNLFTRDKDSLQPAGFVRASMAIPIFFESYFINDIPCSDPEIIKAWKPMGETDPPSTARFVDGGILSNFPINLFYNPNVDIPRLPSFGIDLDDMKDPEVEFGTGEKQVDDEGKNAAKWSFGGYLYRMFNTIRFYYDKDFLIKNSFFKRGIGTIPLKGFGWLNFFLSDADKVKMFVLGAKAATRFLEDFNWNEHKYERKRMQEELDKMQHPVSAS